MIRKCLLVIILLMLFSPAYAKEAENACNAYMAKAQITGDVDDNIKSFSCVYNLVEKDVVTIARDSEWTYHDIVRLLASMNFYRYEETHNKKYLKAAHKFAFRAISIKTNDLNMAMIALFASNLLSKPNDVATAYQYLSTIDTEEYFWSSYEVAKAFQEMKVIKIGSKASAY